MATLHVTKNDKETFLSAGELVEILEVSPRTARHYCANPDKVPDLIMRYLVIRCLGFLPDFKEVRFLRGKIMLNSGIDFNEAELTCFSLVYQERNELRQNLPLLNHNNPPDEFREHSDVQNGPNNSWRVHSLYKRIFKKT